MTSPMEERMAGWISDVLKEMKHSSNIPCPLLYYLIIRFPFFGTKKNETTIFQKSKWTNLSKQFLKQQKKTKISFDERKLSRKHLNRKKSGEKSNENNELFQSMN